MPESVMLIKKISAFITGRKQNQKGVCDLSLKLMTNDKNVQS